MLLSDSPLIFLLLCSVSHARVLYAGWTTGFLGQLPPDTLLSVGGTEGSKGDRKEEQTDQQSVQFCGMPLTARLWKLSSFVPLSRVHWWWLPDTASFWLVSWSACVFSGLPCLRSPLTPWIQFSCVQTPQAALVSWSDLLHGCAPHTGAQGPTLWRALCLFWVLSCHHIATFHLALGCTDDLARLAD